ncbi:MAG: hypothetical protein Q4D62_04405 [Planctomycetia bacterium]|nr:hypothetical protein [Planctomycetia bacterium]
MDNVNQENKSVVNPIRRQILISGATAPLALTLFARNASAQTVHISHGKAPYSAAMIGSQRLNGNDIVNIEDGDVDESVLYKKVVSDSEGGSLRKYYGSPGSGTITYGEPTSEVVGDATFYTYTYTCMWQVGTSSGTTGPTHAGNFTNRYENRKLKGLEVENTDWDGEMVLPIITTQDSLPVTPENSYASVDDFITDVNKIKNYKDESITPSL